MQINNLTLFNFRIYKGSNSIDLSTKGDRNLIVISGKNGYGKTTFLMSLVWCLYGKNMSEVDEFYNEQIKNQGGYAKYIANSLNRLARQEGETLFYVSLRFSGIDIQAIPCKEITIHRTYDIESSTLEKLEVLFDGRPNELINEYGAELFIRDFIIPLESAKFFFFDAEKIVSLAEANEAEQRRELSKAYSEVLGIRKYEDLSQHLNNLHLRYKQDSASSEDRTRLIELQGREQTNEVLLEAGRKRIQEAEELNQQLKYEERLIQQRLIQESDMITAEELEQLQQRKKALEKQIEDQQRLLKELLELAPFAIAGDVLLLVAEQTEKEVESSKKQFRHEEVDAKTERVLYELDSYRLQSEVPIHTKIQDFYNQTLRKLIRKHFFELEEETGEEVVRLHDFNEVEQAELHALLGNLKQSFRDQFKVMNQAYNTLLTDRNNIAKRLVDAESREEDALIKSLRNEQKGILRKIRDCEQERIEQEVKIRTLENEQAQVKAQLSMLTRKIDTADLYREKDELTRTLIAELRDFTKQYKEEKKKSLEKRIKEGLDILMHKKVIKKVTVEMIGEHIDIRLLNARGQEIPKESLSMGEKQLYATALLKALVEESNINFPVFVDSPMQKFDEDHAANVIRYFYPNISEQVVIFPILKKELTEDEFGMLKKNISRCYLINNRGESESEFLEVPENRLFETYNKKYKE